MHSPLRHDWGYDEVQALFDQPLFDTLYQARTVHLEYFHSQHMQLSTLLSIKTGACPEDCAYCSQSGHYDTGVKKEQFLDVDEIVEQAKKAKDSGASRFCMGAAWRKPPKKDFPKVLDAIRAVKDLGLETCVTLGSIDDEQAKMMKAAGLDFYNHNLDTSPEHYKKIITTRTYQERLDTLDRIEENGIRTCCGGILGMGEKPEDRIEFLRQLANREQHPRSVPINQLMPMPGTPLEKAPAVDPLEMARVIAISRIMMPNSVIRLTAGRVLMSREAQALCFFAGANSIFLCETLLTADNPSIEADNDLLRDLGLVAVHADEMRKQDSAV